MITKLSKSMLTNVIYDHNAYSHRFQLNQVVENLIQKNYQYSTKSAS